MVVLVKARWHRLSQFVEKPQEPSEGFHKGGLAQVSASLVPIGNTGGDICLFRHGILDFQLESSSGRGARNMTACLNLRTLVSSGAVGQPELRGTLCLTPTRNGTNKVASGGKPAQARLA